MDFEGNGEGFLSPKTSTEKPKEEAVSKEPLLVEIPESKEYIKDITDAIVSEVIKNEKTWAVMYPEEKDEKIKETLLPLATGVSVSDMPLFFSVLASKLYHADNAVSGPAISFLSQIFSSRIEGVPTDEHEQEPPVIIFSEDQTSEKSDWLGYRIKGLIAFQVQGNAGRWVGSCMESGNLAIQGNTLHETGNKMTGGKITVEGNAGDWLGHSLEGGEINVLGNVGDFTAKNMKNGILRVGGYTTSFDKTAFEKTNEGVIWYRGVKIWENKQFTEDGQKMEEKGEIPKK